LKNQHHNRNTIRFKIISNSAGMSGEHISLEQNTGIL